MRVIVPRYEITEPERAILHKKIIGYYHQDKIKFKRNFGEDRGEAMARRLSEAAVIKLIKKRGMICYLCKREVYLIYAKHSGSQFTLDRRNEVLGHTINNVEICCLSCNLLRVGRQR